MANRKLKKCYPAVSVKITAVSIHSRHVFSISMIGRIYLAGHISCLEPWQRLCKSDESHLLPLQTALTHLYFSIDQAGYVSTCCPVSLEVNLSSAMNKGLSICACSELQAVSGNTCKTCSDHHLFNV